MHLLILPIAKIEELPRDRLITVVGPDRPTLRGLIGVCEQNRSQLLCHRILYFVDALSSSQIDHHKRERSPRGILSADQLATVSAADIRPDVWWFFFPTQQDRIIEPIPMEADYGDVGTFDFFGVHATDEARLRQVCDEQQLAINDLWAIVSEEVGDLFSRSRQPAELHRLLGVLDHLALATGSQQWVANLGDVPRQILEAQRHAAKADSIDS